MLTGGSRPRAALAVWALALAACTDDDTGRACAAATAAPSAGIADETAIAEVVRVARDTACDSFACVATGGLPPYCSRDCSVRSPAKGAAACADDGGCTPPLACQNGACAADDCPPGFVCRAPEAAGPYAARTLCQRRQGCRRDLDCGDVASMRCVALGCLDACLLGAASCTAHVRTCVPMDALGCACTDGAATCGDPALNCQPPGHAPLGAGSVTQTSACLPR